jgi:hypothetical protein
MVNSKGCSLTEAFGDGVIKKKKKKQVIREGYEENGKSLEFIHPEDQKSKDTFSISNEVNVKGSQGISSGPGKILESKEEIDSLKEKLQIHEKEKKDLQDYYKKQLENYKKAHHVENFANFNDDFNDVLLFALLGFFYLIFTDYVYKLGKKSY